MDFFIVTVKGLNSYDFTLFEEVPEFYACYKMLNAAEIARLQELIAQKQN